MAASVVQASLTGVHQTRTASLGNVFNDLQIVPLRKCAERTMGILYGFELDTGFYRRSAFKRAFSNLGEKLILIVVEGEDTKLDDLRGNKLKQFRQRLLGDLAARRVEDMDLLFAHSKGIFRPRILRRHIDAED